MKGHNYQPLFHGQQGGIFPRICGAQAKIVGENRRSHPAEKTQHTWALGTRGADRPFRYPPSPGHVWGPPRSQTSHEARAKIFPTPKLRSRACKSSRWAAGLEEGGGAAARPCPQFLERQCFHGGYRSHSDCAGCRPLWGEHRFRHVISGSLALASLNHTCRNLASTFPQRSPPSLLTTAACRGLRSTPDCRPRRTFLHLSYSCATPCGPALLVTQDPSATLAVHCGKWVLMPISAPIKALV